MRVESPDNTTQALLPLFHDGGPIPEADPDFAAAELLRPPLTPSEKSLAPDLATPINLGFRLRALLGQVAARRSIVTSYADRLGCRRRALSQSARPHTA